MENMMDILFNVCVVLLFGIAEALGTTYETVNVILFVFMWPMLTVFLITKCIKYRKELNLIRKA
jgi:hypothetical protein